MAHKTFKLEVRTVDGLILEAPESRWFRCHLIKPLYQQVVRQYDGNECINAINVFLFYYDGHLFGTKVVSEMGEMIKLIKANCSEREQCNVYYEGCELYYNGCLIKIDCSEC